MGHDTRSHPRRLTLPPGLLHALGVAVGSGLFLLTPGAYWSRLRAGKGPFTPTLSERRRPLPKPSLEGRVFSQEPYLRPTTYCDSRAPEVIALADDFRRPGDWEYTQAIYDFVRNEIALVFEPPHRRVTATLEAGCGTCLDKLNLLVTLARAGGIPARYCTVGSLSPFESGWGAPRPQLLHQFSEDLEAEPDWRLKTIGARLRRLVRYRGKAAFTGGFFNAGWQAELKIRGCWIPANPTWGDAEAAGFDMPLPRLGYDPLILRGVTGSVIGRSEEIRMGMSYWIVWPSLCLLARGALDYVNRKLEERQAHGRRLLTEVGVDGYIRRWRRFYVPVPGVAELGLPPRVLPLKPNP